ncbi:hypothetical protein C8A05DRAFT_39330 [Staphylotrichum tortipilum]|uniref:Uncharacterized protein n=1 Tax=Staphylotrichum tortipilum TaxID=2831512 RepID=A0AAN6MA29_9PEZI|nr:hypothetical protein C8A05DRAFT_39330 [Staphylotrichum longicolle]
MTEEHSPMPSARPTETADAVQQTHQLSFEHLAGDHRRLLDRAIAAVLATNVAELTYAQIVDGHPIEAPRHKPANPDYRPPTLPFPIPPAHTELCPGILEKVHEFRRQFSPDILMFDSKLLSEYCACNPGSRRFKMCLMELVALAVHQIAVILFELDTSVHKNDPKPLLPPKSNQSYWMMYPDGPPPTLFYHRWYQDHDQYPRGISDMVGYWAEAQILGGVVLFDRRDPDTEPAADPDAVYFHSCRKGVTYRIYQLLPEQRKALLDFLLTDEPLSASPLPILGDAKNRIRVDPQEPIRETGIYRNLWEQKDYVPRSRNEGISCVRNDLDFPTSGDELEGRRRASLRNRKHLLEMRARRRARRSDP